MLPFLLGNLGNQKSKDGGKQQPDALQMQLMQSLLKGEQLDQASILGTLAKSSNNPGLAQILSMTQPAKNKRANPAGFAPIIQIANNDIMGRLSKFFAK
ncbi:MAG: hypothetical protein FWD76_04845 [Firmicutes bacterium]|nr:hypothetical protein [Bacillota bacterium]